MKRIIWCGSFSILTSLALFCVGSLLGGTALAYPTNNITLTFNLAAQNLGSPIPADFVGLSTPRTYISGANGSFRPFDPTWAGGNYQQYTNLLGQIGVKHWRTISEYSGYATDPTPAQDDKFFATVAASGGTSVIYSLHGYCEGTNSIDNSNYADNIASAVHILSTPADSALLESFALDNEPNFKINQHCPDAPPAWTLAQYESQWESTFTNTENGIAQAGFSWAPFSGLDCGGGNPAWELQFAIDEAPEPFLRMATQHEYDANCTSNSPDAVGMATTNLSSDRVAQWQNIYSNQLAGASTWPNDFFGNPLAFRMTEASAFNNGGGTGGPNGNTNGQNFSTALWELDFCHWWAQKGCAGVNPFTRVVDYSSPIFRNSDGSYTAMPYAYGLKAFSLSGSGLRPVLDAGLNFSNPDNINVTAYGALSSDGHDFYVTVINKTFNYVGAHAANVTIPTPGNFTGVTSARYLLLSSTPDGQNGNATILQVAYLGGATIPTSGNWNGTWQPLSLNNGGVTTVVQPATAVIIDFQNIAQSIPQLKASVAGSSIQLTVSMSPPSSTIVQASTNLTDWSNIYTNTPPFTFIDSVNGGSYRFYRALLGP